ncbi:MAG: hypothetical protein RIE52_12805 [Balneola sp.]|jgi:hypothetical protein
MKLEKVLDKLNSFEKNSFLKVLENIRLASPKNAKAVDKILSQHDNEFKNVDNINISSVFDLLENEFIQSVKGEFLNTTSQIDLLIDIIIRDGNCIMSREWFNNLYESELKKLKIKIRELGKEFSNEKSQIDPVKKRDYLIYKSCLETAFTNDLLNNQEEKITQDELSILLTLSEKLRLSQEEIKLINYMIVPIKKLDIDEVINQLKNIGTIFYSKKTHTIFVPDEVVRALRKVRGKEVADKFFRRVLRLMREPQINLICRNHNIDWKASLDDKIESIIKEGVSFSGALKEDAYKPQTTLTEKKNTLNNLCNKGLKITPHLKGTTIEEKIKNLISYFENVEKDEKVGISVDGYQKLLTDLSEALPKLNKKVKGFFEFQEEQVLKSDYLIDYNIKPRDILETLTAKEIESFCAKKEISTRGNEHINILKQYKNIGNLFLENYESIGYRNLKELKENGIIIKEADLGSKFEELTKVIFNQLGLNVDEELRKDLNTRKAKIDIVLNLGKNSLIIVECKSKKEAGYNKFSSVSRQIKSYTEIAKKNDFVVLKSLLIAPEFSDDFVSDCNLDYELNLSLITAESLMKILDGFKNSKLKSFPHKLLLRDVLISDEMVLKALKN